MNYVNAFAIFNFYENTAKGQHLFIKYLKLRFVSILVHISTFV